LLNIACEAGMSFTLNVTKLVSNETSISMVELLFIIYALSINVL